MAEKIPDKKVSVAEEEVTPNRNFVRANWSSFWHIIITTGGNRVQPESAWRSNCSPPQESAALLHLFAW
jgi:hypothetical protein